MPVKDISELQNLLDTRANAFEEFKKANDARLDAIEKSLAHAELDEKVNKISDSMVNIEKTIAELQRPSFGAGAVKENYGQFFKDVIEGRYNSVVVGVSGNGGYAVPDGLDKIVTDYIMSDCVMMQLCRVAPFIAGYKKNVTLTPGTAEFGVETTVASKKDSPTLGQVSAVVGKLLSKQEISQEAKIEMTMDPENWVRDCIGMLFSETLEAQALSGSGSDGQTKGVLGYINDSVGNADFTKIEFLKTGQAGALASTGPLDKLKEMISKLKTTYRRNAKWLMSRSAELLIQQVKDTTGQYIWQPSIIAGEHDKLFGHEVHISDSMPAVASGSNSIIFGDFKRAVRIGMEANTYIVRDPITVFPLSNLLFAKIFDLTLMDSRALKILQFAS